MIPDYFFRTIAERRDWLTYRAANFLSEEGRQIPYLFLSDPSQANGNATKLRVYIQGSIHGDEPAADQGIMALIGKMDANSTWTSSLLEKMDIKILPRYNVDGVHYFQRQLASNYDPNRDLNKFDRQQTRDIRGEFIEYNPHLCMDLHEFRGPAVYGGEWQHGNDALIYASYNLNIHEDIRAAQDDIFLPVMDEYLTAHGLRWDPYVVGTASDEPSRIEFSEVLSEAKYAHFGFGMTQALSFLFEIRGISLANQHFQRRVATALLKLEATLDTARDRAEEVYELVNSAREEFISSTEDVIVTEYTTPEERTFTMVNTNNGSIVDVLVDYNHSNPAVANLTRSRPEAYLIPRTWHEIAELMKLQGLEVQTLEAEFRGTVESLNITSSELATQLYEGRVLNTVTTEASYKDIVLPAGSFLVSTRQQNAALAFASLEPENVDSFVSWGIIPVQAAWEYPIFRILE